MAIIAQIIIVSIMTFSFLYIPLVVPNSLGKKKPEKHSDAGYQYDWDSLETAYQDVIGHLGTQADGAAINLKKALAPRFGAYNISFDSWIQSHGGHACAYSSVSGNFAHFDSAGS